ncbi:hypothetical protein BST63_03500, partial [Bradyrhizobium canariense]
QDAAAIGPATSALCDLILDERSHPEQGFRACLGILRLAASYGLGEIKSERWATSSRNPRATSYRYAWATSSESADDACAAEA